MSTVEDGKDLRGQACGETQQFIQSGTELPRATCVSRAKRDKESWATEEVGGPGETEKSHGVWQWEGPHPFQSR